MKKDGEKDHPYVHFYFPSFASPSIDTTGSQLIYGGLTDYPTGQCKREGKPRIQMPPYEDKVLSQFKLRPSGEVWDSLEKQEEFLGGTSILRHPIYWQVK